MNRNRSYGGSCAHIFSEILVDCPIFSGKTSSWLSLLTEYQLHAGLYSSSIPMLGDTLPVFRTVESPLLSFRERRDRGGKPMVDCRIGLVR